jgi:plastocyanin
MVLRGSVILAAVIAAAACSSSDDDGGQGPGDTPEGDVLVRNNEFDPDLLEVAAGATVVWAWASGGTLHNVTFDDDVASGNRASGTFERTFDAAGDYPYHCTIHGPSMSGVVSVGAAPAPGTGGEGTRGGGGTGGGGYPGGGAEGTRPPP